MGILKKLMFWRRDDEMDFDKFADKELSTDHLGINQPAGMEEKSPFAREPSQPLPPHLQEAPAGVQQSTAPRTQNRDLELISSKLDTLKAILTSMDQRISNLERVAGVEKKDRLW
jgi:hypothetical protein